MESGGSIILSDGKRELTSSEISELQHSASTGSKYCSFLRRDTAKVMWDLCQVTRRYLCEYKGGVLN